MTRDEYLVILATARATANQVGAILGEFERLGFGDADRAERLAVTAVVLGLDELASTRDLTMGEAGRLLRMLQHCPDRSSLPAPAAADDQDQASDGERGPTLAEAITLALALLIGAWQRPPGAAGTGQEARGD